MESIKGPTGVIYLSLYINYYILFIIYFILYIIIIVRYCEEWFRRDNGNSNQKHRGYC